MKTRHHRGALRDVSVALSVILVAGVAVAASAPAAYAGLPESTQAQGVALTPFAPEIAEQNPTWPPQPRGQRVYIPVVSDARLRVPPIPAPTPTPVVIQPTYNVITTGGFPVLVVSGSGAIVTLPQMASGSASVSGLTGPALTAESAGVWRLNHRLRIGAGVTLRVTRDTASWLKLRSNTTVSTTVDRRSFVYLETLDGNLIFEDTKVTSWDFGANGFDTTPDNGRAFVRAEGNARMDIVRSEFAYLGSPEAGGTYGLSWRDTATDFNGQLLTRVTGRVADSDIHHLYYGFYSYAAAGMEIVRNKFRNSDSYGFDPHDFSHDFLVEGNEAFSNGNHGFIISRGCYNFTFRRNKAYNNTYTVDSASQRAHGFMLDPGGLASAGEYAPSYNNLLEFNEAYNNQGYGIRMLDTLSNTVRNNIFRNNLYGVTIERNSFGNRVENNTIENNTETGLQVLGDPDLGHSHDNLVAGNIFRGNDTAIQINQSAYRNALNQNSIVSNTTGIQLATDGAENTWSRNVITGASRLARVITLAPVSNDGIQPTAALTISVLTLSGTAEPNASIEVFSGDATNMIYFEGVTTTNSSGEWRFTASAAWRGTHVSAVQTATGRGSSAFATAIRIVP
jgi:mannuronan 5-epimerase